VISLAALLLLSPLPPNLIDERMCDGKFPERVTLAQLNQDVSSWEGRCVTVAGRSLAGSLVEGQDKQADGLPRLRLGLYEREGAFARMAIGKEGGTWEVTGAVDSCARIAAQVRADAATQAADEAAAGRPPPAPVMLGGSCHYQGGPVIWIASYRRPIAPK